VTEESGKNAPGEEAVSYSAAMAEVESILGELESSVVDVDHLAERVRRASELLTLCRDRLAVVEVDVAGLVEALDPGDEPTNGGAGTTR